MHDQYYEKHAISGSWFAWQYSFIHTGPLLSQVHLLTIQMHVLAANVSFHLRLVDRLSMLFQLNNTTHTWPNSSPAESITKRSSSPLLYTRITFVSICVHCRSVEVDFNTWCGFLATKMVGCNKDSVVNSALPTTADRYNGQFHRYVSQE